MTDGRTYPIGWQDEEDFDVAVDEGPATANERSPRSEPWARDKAALERECERSNHAPAPSLAPMSHAPAFRPPVAELPCFPRAHLLGYFPAFFARSGLFPAERVLSVKQSDGPRAIVGQDKMKGTLKGPRLSIGDKLVLEALVDLAKREGLALHEPLRCSARAVAREMGWKDNGGSTSRHIWACIERLARAHVTFDLGDGIQRSGKLLLSAAKRGGEGLELCFDAGFALPAFGAAKQYKINRARREGLHSPMAKWLHDFASTHSKPRPIDLGYLRERSGFRDEPKRFVEQIRRAAEELMLVAPELLSAYSLEDKARSSKKWLITLYRGEEKAGMDL